MNDPHVKTLYFNVSSEEGLSYENPKPLKFSNDLGTFELRDGKLTITPTDHFRDKDEALMVFGPYLNAWEINTDLTSDVGTIRFKYDRSEIIDRDPSPPGGSQTIQLGAASFAMTGMSASINITRNRYPEPPRDFGFNHNVERAYHRWRRFRAGYEPLQGMAYFMLTHLQNIAGGNRELTAQTFMIDPKILQEIGRLSTNKGDATTVRKVVASTTYDELTSSEKNWLENAVKRIIRRLGEHAAGVPLTQITMSDLPPM